MQQDRCGLSEAMGQITIEENGFDGARGLGPGRERRLRGDLFGAVNVAEGSISAVLSADHSGSKRSLDSSSYFPAQKARF